MVTAEGKYLNSVSMFPQNSHVSDAELKGILE